MNTDWRAISWISGYTGYYVSNTGEVGSTKKRNRNAFAPKEKRVIKQWLSGPGKGYYAVTLYGDGPPLKFRVHALVARAFLGAMPEGAECIRHINGDSLDNRVSNLVYGTYTQNRIDESILNKRSGVLKHLDEVAFFCNDVSTSKGFWDNAPSPDVYLAKIALIHSEASEILEAYRKEKGPQALTDEFADVFIRLVDLWSVMYQEGLVGSLRESILNKIEVNTNRPRKHGNLI